MLSSVSLARTSGQVNLPGQSSSTSAMSSFATRTPRFGPPKLRPPNSIRFLGYSLLLSWLARLIWTKRCVSITMIFGFILVKVKFCGKILVFLLWLWLGLKEGSEWGKKKMRKGVRVLGTNMFFMDLIGQFWNVLNLRDICLNLKEVNEINPFIFSFEKLINPYINIESRSNLGTTFKRLRCKCSTTYFLSTNK